jgi:hypothetical protein
MTIHSRTILAGSALVLAAATMALSSAGAQDRELDQSGERAFCSLVETLGNNSMNDEIKRQIDALYAGFTQEVSKRKTFHINGTDSVRFSGCNMTIMLDGELKRKIRRDAAGKIYVEAVMQNIQFDRGSRLSSGTGCIKQAEVDKVRLSNTLRIGEAIYRRVANRFVDSQQCFTFRR